MRLPGLVLLLCCPATVLAHGTPADFAEMTLQQLAMQVVDDGPTPTDGATTSNSRASRWSFGYRYARLELDGYRNGTDDLDDDEVLWAGPGNPRTDANFPVLPTTIRQEIHLLSLGWTPVSGHRLQLSVPYIRQGTDHISIVPNYPTFLIRSSGIGDLRLGWQTSHSPAARPAQRLDLGLGLSLPTGSIDEEGDTPRAPGDQQLPYTMQLGSGSWDLSGQLAWTWRGQASWTLGMAATVRTADNDRDYRLGNHATVFARCDLPAWGAVRLSPGLEWRHTGRIRGQDDEITVPGPYPYPASITNPRLYGGDKVSMVLRAELGLPGAGLRHRITGDLGLPVHQNLNGPQPREGVRFTLGYQLNL